MASTTSSNAQNHAFTPPHSPTNALQPPYSSWVNQPPQSQAPALSHNIPSIALKTNVQYQWPGPQSLGALVPPSDSEIARKPWKYIGYPGFATWSASSKDAFVVRRFNTAHARVILYMQHKIAQKESELAELDRRCITRPDDVDNGTFRYDIEPRRNALLDDLRVQLKEYSRSYPHSSETLAPETWPRLKNV